MKIGRFLERPMTTFGFLPKVERWVPRIIDRKNVKELHLSATVVNAAGAFGTGRKNKNNVTFACHL